ncbi:transposase [Streptomyces inhibens]|uniref:transposase n=1 Tax=Streptomyces inhibens TaxID=2293571 RepID=UPI00379B58FD
MVGVDEYATRKGRIYGTVLVDVESRRPVDLLPGREASSPAKWLAKRPGIEAVCRDRAPFFAEGASAGAPQAVQVADRWQCAMRRLVVSPIQSGRICWNEGCTNAWKLWEEIIPLGYKGSYGRVSAYLRKKRTSPRPITAQPPAPRLVTRWILSHPETLIEIEQLRLKAVLVHCPELEALTGHTRSFAQMFDHAGFRLLRKRVLFA